MRVTAPRLTVGGGLLVMVVSGVVASRYTPFWSDPDEGCALLGTCPAPAAAVVLRLMWWAAGAGFVIVLAGLAMGWRRLPASGPALRLPAWAHAVAAGVAGLVLTVMVGTSVVLGALIAPQLVPAVVCVFWLAQAWAVAVLGGAPVSRRGCLTGLAAGAPATAVTVWLVGGPADGGLLPLLDGVVLAAAVLLGRALPARGERVDVPRLAAAVAVAAVAALSVAGAVALPAVHRAVPPEDPAAHVAPEPPLPPVPAAAAPAPPPAPPPPPVEARAACTAADLRWSTGGWDAAMGKRAVGVVATHAGPAPCYVDGFAGVTVTQGGRPLRLTFVPGFSTESAEPVPAQRVDIAPGGAARFVLFWAGYGAAADQETPQSLAVTLAGAGGPVDVPLTEGPAPFDLIDGGTVEVGPWQPGPA